LRLSRSSKFIYPQLLLLLHLHLLAQGSTISMGKGILALSH
jgi:hypothetical protein